MGLEGPVGYGPVVILVVIAIVFAITNVAGSWLLHFWIKKYRTGPVKETPYETGMPVIHDSRRRFNVRYYLVAMLFLLFDVEIVFLYPWAMLFSGSVHDKTSQAALNLPPAMAVGSLPDAWTALVVIGSLFIAILMVGFAYEWKRGVFRFD